MTISTDAVIIGAGPCGLFQVFELGLLGLKAHLVDSLPQVGGQCSELYPDKPIYDIPAIPSIGAQELVDQLMIQIAPFDPEFHLDQAAKTVVKKDDGRFEVVTTLGTTFDAGVVIIAGGVGAFEPRRLKVKGAPELEGTSLFYSVKDRTKHYGKDIVIFGGGDSALDWTLDFVGHAASVTLVHRSQTFRAQPANVSKMRAHCDAMEMMFVEGTASGVVTDDEGNLTGVQIRGKDHIVRTLECQELLCFWGMSPKLGPIGEWGLELYKKTRIPVDTEKFQTNIEGIYAVGDINWYPGKKKLILSGFHEAALAAFAIKAHLFPGEKVHLQYTTTSPKMHQRLGVANPFTQKDVDAGSPLD
ncbi:MAG: NAD(P)/FAD-dependent oxidoreductase [Deltaproteobacteria bacterium]|nr:NAD(P)/FAD-dependent oxidoreductase [Deltaproteobacteria bacterium]